MSALLVFRFVVNFCGRSDESDGDGDEEDSSEHDEA